MAADQKFPDDLIIRTGEELERERHGRVTPTAIQIRMGGGNRQRIEKVWTAHVGARPSSSMPADGKHIGVPDSDAAMLIEEFASQSMAAARRLMEEAFRAGFDKAERAVRDDRERAQAKQHIAALEMQELEAALRHQEAATEEAQRSSERHAQEAADAKAAFRDLQADMAVLREQIRSLTEAVAEQRLQRDTAEARAATAISRLESAQEKIMDLRESAAVTEAALAETERRAQSLDARCNVLDETLTEARSARMELEAELASTRARNSALEGQLRSAEERQQACEQCRADLAEETARLFKDGTASAARAATFEERCEGLSHELARLRSELDRERERRIRLEAAQPGPVEPHQD
ncbi:coiled-coil domain-containing protein [Indioceanicola profundi]|uniref:DNA-binding protein n=1 Tax=Indioceanicola profundi TaxID=2220096 RepID=UPI0013C45C01|nr:DNA-binding protein [Indioceanicola profundi]